MTLSQEPRERPAISVVVGTAGHIDHGKSSLVHRLTGTHPSRLKEEQERGMTIDIGYAELEVSDKVTAGVIDVPGHEKFIRNMVAGASGVDFVLLVIAADDGIMPQTREHLHIMRLLGIERGMTVITKIDAVDAELLELVQEEVKDWLSGTFLEARPTMLVSNNTGQGIDELREALRAELLALPPRDTGGVFRMPIQRSFSIRGHGTVVTGVPVSGRVEVGDELEILPGGQAVRVRGLEVHHVTATSASAGHRTALNVTDVSYKDVARGHVIAAKGYFGAAALLEARFEYLPHHEQPMRNDLCIRFHVGTAEVMGRVVLLDRDDLLPGESALVQIRLDEPVIVAAGDHYVLRLESPVVTLGGGKVLGETRWRFKRHKDWLVENIAQKEVHIADRRGYLEYVVRSHGKRLVAAPDLARELKCRPEELKEDLDELVREGRVRRQELARAFVHADMFRQAMKDVGEALLALHGADRLQAGFATSRIVKESLLDLPMVEAAVEELVRRGKVEPLKNRLYRSAEWTGGLSKDDFRMVTRIEAMHAESLFGAPIRSEIRAAIDKPEKKLKELMDYLFQMGTLVSIGEDLALHRQAVEEAEYRLVRRILDGGPMPSKEFKDIIEASRKYVIPLLEYFDKKGLTRRDDNDRALVPGWEKRVAPSTLERLRPGEPAAEA